MYSKRICPADPGAMVTLKNGEKVPQNLLAEVRENYARLFYEKNEESKAYQAMRELVAKAMKPEHVIDENVKGWLKNFLKSDGDLHPHVRAIILNAAEHGVKEIELCDETYTYQVVTMPIPSKL